MSYKNINKQREACRLWRKNHPNYHKNYIKKYFQNKPWAKTMFNISSRCCNKNHLYYKKGIKNFLTIADLEYLWFRDKAYLMKHPSIDRINSNKNYILNNCRFIEFITNIKNHHNTNPFKKGYDSRRNIKGINQYIKN